MDPQHADRYGFAGRCVRCQRRTASSCPLLSPDARQFGRVDGRQRDLLRVPGSVRPGGACVRMEYPCRGRGLYAAGAETGPVSLAPRADSWVAAAGAPAAHVRESGPGMGEPVRVRDTDAPTGNTPGDPDVPGVPRAQDGGPGDSAAVGP